MQKVMDNYAGGIKTNYKYNEAGLAIAAEEIARLNILADDLHADSMHELLFIHELKDRLTICAFLIKHMLARKETRWHSFAENLDYPEKDDRNFNKYVNSRLENGEIKIIIRDLVTGGEKYEHSN